MVMRNLSQNISLLETVYPASIAANKALDVGVDTQGYNSAVFVAGMGANVGAGILLPVAQESDVLGSGYTDVVPTDLEGVFANTAQNVMQKVGYRGIKRFVAMRFVLVSGTSQTAVGQIVLGNYAFPAAP